MKDHLLGSLDRRSFLRLAVFGWLPSLMKMDKLTGLPTPPVSSATPSPSPMLTVLETAVAATSVELVVAVDTRDTSMRVKNGEIVRGFRGGTPSGIELNEAVLQHLKSKHNLLVGRLTAERINLMIGSALPLEQEVTSFARGRNLIDGMPQAIELTSMEIRQAIAPVVEQIVSFIALNMKHIPAEFTAGKPIISIVLTGEFGLLKKLDQRLQEVTGLPVTVAPSSRP